MLAQCFQCLDNFKHPIFSRITERHLYADIFLCYSIAAWRGCPCTPDNFCYHMIAFVLPRRSMLPVEILDNIFSRLDSSSLEASSAAHHLFSCIAERHLYADICLDALTIETQWVSDSKMDSKTSITVVQLSNLLEERPHIANYVFSLTIVLSDEIAESSLPFMTLLRNLIKMTIENRSGVHKFKKLTLPKSLQLSLENCLRLPSIQEVEVTGIEIPFSFLHHCKGIKTLKVEGCDKLAGPELDSSNDGPFLKDLIVIDVRVQALKTLAPRMAKCCKRLQHFTVSPYYNEPEAFLAIELIFISCSNTLTSLDIDLGFFCKLILYFHSELIYQSLVLDSHCRIPNLPSLPHLKEATLHGKISYEEGITRPFALFFGFTDLLENMPTLLQLTLHLHLGSNFEIDHFKADLTALDSFLGTHCHSAKVIYLGISIRKWRSSRWIECDDIPHIMRYPSMKRMIEQNTLVIASPPRCYRTRSL